MAFDSTPAGTIKSFGGIMAPAGYLLCNGAAVSRATYAALYAAIGTVWGYGDNSTTFNIPDMRGRFPRGRDGGAGRDPDSASRTISATGGAAGDSVGSVQVNATKKNGLTASATAPAVSGSTSKSLSGASTTIQGGHDHTVAGCHGTPSTGMGHYPSPTLLGVSDGLVSKTSSISGSHSHDVIGGAVDISHTHTVPTVTISGGDSETRLVNANVNFIIKV